MKIAVTYENGMVFQHFGRTQQFKVYEVVDGKMVDMKVVSSGGSGHGALAGVLSSLGVNVLICGGMGMGAKNALAAAGIEVRGGVQGEADLAVAAFLEDKLAFDPDYRCDHHDHHHGDDHECGDHGCGEHDCDDHDCHH